EATVLDGLFKIREELDGTLAFRASCNRGFCGECTLRINRGGRLACMTRVAAARTKDGEVTVEPTRYVRVLKDLVYDVDGQLWQKIKAVQPWLQPAGPQPEREHILRDEQLRPVRNAMKCYYCGLCDEGCSVIPVDNTFLGPTALTKAFRLRAGAQAIEPGKQRVERGRRGGPGADERDERGVVLREGRPDGWGENVRRLNRDSVAVAKRDLNAEAFERLEELA